ncbi:P-loop containing nucleoside triphosphate hydrolase protein, partial [Phialemonium atrogriseum]
DLGTTANEVQTELEKNFSLASRWGCILLLDEADVFLASRERKDFIRNGLVAVFLRVLEYYSGILFLTTNRVGDFDEAFASRIHMSLHYPKLDLEKTRKVFKLNLDLIKEKFEQQGRMGKLIFEEQVILEFAEKHYAVNEPENMRGLRWNGRQIRNACQTALAMAEFEAYGKQITAETDPDGMVILKRGHFTTIEKAYDEFAVYLGNVYGMDMDERAAEARLRAEEAKKKKKKTSKVAERALKESTTNTATVGTNTVHPQPGSH